MEYYAMKKRKVNYDCCFEKISRYIVNFQNKKESRRAKCIMISFMLKLHVPTDKHQDRLKSIAIDKVKVGQTGRQIGVETEMEVCLGSFEKESTDTDNKCL